MLQFEESIAAFSVRSKTSFRDWTKMEFMGGDINEFIDVIAGYKSTIAVGRSSSDILLCRRMRRSNVDDELGLYIKSYCRIVESRS